MKIMVFLHGTSIMHKNAVGRTRAERVRQVVDRRDGSLYDFASYVPIDNVVRKLHAWHQQGADIVYLSSHKRIEDVETDSAVLQSYHFPSGQVYYCQQDEGYGDVAEKVRPDILIEDDCESIGGITEMTYPQIKSEEPDKIKSIFVQEFGGIDHLPDDIAELKKY